jgi:pilus assembly protein CpaC
MLRILCIAGALLLGTATMVAADPAPPAEATPAAPARPAEVRGEGVTLEVGSGRLFYLPRAAASVFAADPKTAEVRPASPTSLFVFGVAVGRTTISAIDASGVAIRQFEVLVTPSGAGAALAAATVQRNNPGSRVGMQAIPNGMTLHGPADTPVEAWNALDAARSYAPPGGKVSNDMTLAAPVQVNLQVRIAEMSRNLTRQLGVDWQTLGNIGRVSVGFATHNFISLLTNAPGSLSITDNSSGVNAVLDALAQDQLVHVLAEPNLTTMSGEPASFTVGGEFPIPVAQQNNTITVEFKNYGISLGFLPTVLDSGQIIVKVRPEVSQLTTQGSVQLTTGNASIVIPALTVRRAETTVTLGSGQTFAIAGLLSDNTNVTGTGVTGLGDIPVLGALFRSDAFQRNETELVIIVTPYLVRPVNNPAVLRAPTDGWVPPNDAERILLLRQQGAATRQVVPIGPHAVGPAGFFIE